MISNFLIFGEDVLAGALFPFELLIAVWMFLIGRKRRSNYIARVLISITVYILLFMVVPPAPVSPASPDFTSVWVCWYRVLYCVAVVAACVFFGYLCYNERILSLLFCALAGYSVQHIAYFCYQFIHIFLPLPDSLEKYFIQYLVMAFIYVVFYQTFSKLLQNEECINIDNQEVILFSVIVLLVNVVLSVWQSAEPRGVLTKWVESMYSVIACLLILFFQFSIFSRYKEKSRADLIHYMWLRDQEHYRLSKETIDTLNVKCHDLKHILLSQRGQLDQSTADELEQAATVYDSVLKTGNEALDVVLTEKFLFCANNQIGITCMIDGSALRFMDDNDIYCLFGNILDNAIEAVLKLKDTSRRQINLTMGKREELLFLRIENYFENQLSFVNGLPQTTKADEKYHGFGLKSISLVTQKYGGNVSISTQGTPPEQTFCLNIFFPGKDLK